MNWEAFKLPDGRTVRPHHRDPGVGMIGSNRHAVTFDAGQVAVTNENGVTIYSGPVQPGAARRQAGGATPAQRAAAGQGGDAGRWATLNTFVDASMSGLTRAEVLVWFVLFRDVRNGTARTGMADIARRAGCSKRAVVDAVGALISKGMLVVIRKGRRNSGPSTYIVAAIVQGGVSM